MTASVHSSVQDGQRLGKHADILTQSFHRFNKVFHSLAASVFKHGGGDQRRHTFTLENNFAIIRNVESG
jgi:hypothetical protein